MISLYSISAVHPSLHAHLSLERDVHFVTLPPLAHPTFPAPVLFPRS